MGFSSVKFEKQNRFGSRMQNQPDCFLLKCLLAWFVKPSSHFRPPVLHFYRGQFKQKMRWKTQQLILHSLLHSLWEKAHLQNIGNVEGKIKQTDRQTDGNSCSCYYESLAIMVTFKTIRMKNSHCIPKVKITHHNS